MKILGRLVNTMMGGLVSSPVFAALELPSYAQGGGDLKQTATTKGRELTELLLYVGGIVAIAAIVIGSIYMKTGQRDKAKAFIFGGVGGLILDSVVYAIAQWAAK